MQEALKQISMSHRGLFVRISLLLRSRRQVATSDCIRPMVLIQSEQKPKQRTTGEASSSCMFPAGLDTLYPAEVIVRIKMILFLVFSGLCFGQVELVNNQWPTDPQGLKFFPDSKVSYVSRLTRSDGTGVSGVPYHYTIKQYAGQGNHTHETANGTVLSRPPAVFIPSTGLPSGGENGTSDAQGYMVANVEFNNFAGWYTVCVTNAYGERCVNNNTRYFTQQNGYPLYLERYTGGLPPYNSNSVNQPQSQHTDSRHSVSSAPESQNLSYIFEGYVTRWVTH